MNKVIFFFLFFLFSLNSYSENLCLDFFKHPNTPSSETLDIGQQIDHQVTSLETQFTTFQHVRWHTKLFAVLRALSGNSLESAVRQSRINLGERFYRLMRAGDTTRAVNYVRDMMGAIRSSAEIVFWARETILQLEEQITNGALNQEKLEKYQGWVSRLQDVINKESKALNRYGDAQMVVYQLMRLHKMYDSSVARRLRPVLAESAKEIMTESVPSETTNTVTQINAEISKDLGSNGLSAAEIEQYINTRITQVSPRMYGMSSFRPMFPQLFQSKTPVEKKYTNPIEQAIQEDMDFITMVFNGESPSGKRVYGPELPLIFAKKRENAWEALAVVRNLIAKAFTGYISIIRALDRNNTESMSQTITKLNEEGGFFKQVADRLRSLSLKRQKAISFFIRDISIYDAIHIHASKVDVIDGLLTKYQQGFETRESFIEALKSMTAAQDGSGVDFIKSYSRIVEYNSRFTDVIEIVRQMVKEGEKKFPDNKNAMAIYKNLLQQLEEAQEAVANKTVSEISLNSEPNLVNLAIKQTIVFGGAGGLTVGGFLYIISPDTYHAVVQFFGLGGIL